VKKIILHSIFLLQCCILNAQYWTQQHYNVENGLPDNYTFAIEKFQDEIYVATDGGLTTFDGINFKIHNRKEIRYPVALLNKNDSILYVGSWLDGILAKQSEEITNVYNERINRILKNDGKALTFNTYQRMSLLAFNQQQAIDTIVYFEKQNENRRIAIDADRMYVHEGTTISTYDWEGKPQPNFPYETSETIEAICSIKSFLFLGDQEGNLTWISKKNPNKYKHIISKNHSQFNILNRIKTIKF